MISKPISVVGTEDQAPLSSKLVLVIPGRCIPRCINRLFCLRQANEASLNDHWKLQLEGNWENPALLCSKCSHWALGMPVCEAAGKCSAVWWHLIMLLLRDRSSLICFVDKGRKVTVMYGQDLNKGDKKTMNSELAGWRNAGGRSCSFPVINCCNCCLPTQTLPGQFYYKTGTISHLHVNCFLEEGLFIGEGISANYKLFKPTCIRALRRTLNIPECEMVGCTHCCAPVALPFSGHTRRL